MSTVDTLIQNEQTKLLMEKYGVSWFKFDEESGSVTDSKGSAVGTVGGGATRIEGWNGQGKALSFNGSNSYVQFNQRVFPVGEKSIRFKIKRNGSPSGFEQILTTCLTSGNHGEKIYVADQGILYWASFRGVNGANRFNVQTVNVCDGQWHDILLTWDGTTSENGVKIYIDDMSTPIKNSSASTTEITAPSNNLTIGANVSLNTAERFNGQIDNLEIYNKVLSPSDFNFDKSLILHGGGYKRYESLDYTSSKNPLDVFSLTNYFKFDEASGNVTDSKGSATGVINGGVTRVAGWNDQGNALSFDGSTGYVQFSNPLLPTGELSIRFKIKKHTYPNVDSVNETLVANTFATANRGVRSWVQPNGSVFFAGTYASNTNYSFTLSTTTDVCDGQWHDVLFTWDGTTGENGVKLYVDDMVNPESTTRSVVQNTLTGTDNFIIGRASDRSDRFLNGQIDNLEIYNGVITVDDLFPRSASWSTVSTPLPSSTQFIEQGMDSLSPLLDRKVTHLPPVKMEDKTSILIPNGEGKVFGKKLDLRKLIDIRSVRTEVK